MAKHIHILIEGGKCVVRSHSTHMENEREVQWHLHGGGNAWVVFPKGSPFDKKGFKDGHVGKTEKKILKAEARKAKPGCYCYAVVTADGDCVVSSGAHPDIIWP